MVNRIRRKVVVKNIMLIRVFCYNKQIEKEASLARKRKAFQNMLKMREQAGENEKV